MEMNETRLDAIMQSYGAAPEHWPPEEGPAALSLLKRSDRARRLWVEAAALDSLLVPAQAPQPSEELVRRLKAVPADTAMQRRRPAAWRTLAGLMGPVRLPVGAAFAAVALAFVAGLAAPSPFGLEPAVPAIQAALVETDAEVDDAETEDDIAIDDSWADETEATGTDGDDMELAILDLALD